MEKEKIKEILKSKLREKKGAIGFFAIVGIVLLVVIILIFTGAIAGGWALFSNLGKLPTWIWIVIVVVFLIFLLGGRRRR